jgi:hypothetical protein
MWNLSRRRCAVAGLNEGWLKCEAQFIEQFDRLLGSRPMSESTQNAMRCCVLVYMRNAFFNGASCCFHAMLSASDHDDTEKFAQLVQEMIDFDKNRDRDLQLIVDRFVTAGGDRAPRS